MQKNSLLQIIRRLRDVLKDMRLLVVSGSDNIINALLQNKLLLLLNVAYVSSLRTKHKS